MDKREFPTLQALAMEVAARNYHLHPELTGLPERVKETIIEKSIEFCGESENSVNVTAPHIVQEKYWKACCQKNKKLMNSLKLEDHGFSYKIAFLEKHIEKMLESVNEYQVDREKVLKTAKVVSPWVFNLELKLNAPDLNIEEVCRYLYNLINLKVKCSEGKNVDYKKKIIGMKFSQARDLSEALRLSQNLIVLNLTGNLIDDELFKFIVPGLVLNTSLVELNLSYNKIGDEGARKLSKYLIKNQILTHLNLSNNCVAYDGSRFIAQALKLNSTLEWLSLKLNSIDDKAGSRFFKDLSFNNNLKVLDLEANLLSSMTLRKICLYLQVPSSLREIYIGTNNFLATDFEVIVDCLPNEPAREHFRKSKFTEIKL